MKTLKKFHAVLFLAIFLTGCLPATWPPTWLQQTGRLNSDFAPQKLHHTDFAKKIRKLTITSQDPKSSNLEKAEAHRRLAILYLIPRNPDSDFRSAANELGKFLEIAPDKLDNLAAASWATALKSGEEYQSLKTKVAAVAALNKKNSQLKTKVAALNKKNSQLTKEKKDLAEANTELMKTIEKLTKLDLSLEKKRRNFR